MADREWWCAELPGGRQLRDDKGEGEFPNRETAAVIARAHALEQEKPVMLVKYTRKDVKTFERQLSVKETDIGTVSPA